MTTTTTTTTISSLNKDLNFFFHNVLITSSSKNSRKKSPSLPNKKRRASLASRPDELEPAALAAAGGDAVEEYAGATLPGSPAEAAVTFPLAWNDSKACACDGIEGIRETKERRVIFQRVTVRFAL